MDGNIGLLGGGNMAEALARGLLAAGTPETRLRASDPAPERRALLTERFAIATTDDNAALTRWADVLVVAVKPQVMLQALASIRDALKENTLVVSIAAGISTATIESCLPKGARVVRAMPNAAAMALAAATAVASGVNASAADLQVATKLFESVGRCVVVPESALDAVTGLSGSGPAYVLLVIEALADGGVRAGLPADVAMLLAAQTVYGAGKLQLETGEHPALLRDRVTSPAGTTVAGLAALEAGKARDAFVAAVEAATNRAKELGR